MITMARPALKDVPTSSVSSAFSTVLPSPGASMSAAIVAMDSAAMMVWLTPTTMVRLASGRRTLLRSCHGVDPSDVPASTVVAGTCLIACAVMRIAGGIA